jgi:NAD(P)-dependent dehydrogenase (short-subunit alcohol dehydrogenase family)
MPTAAVTGGTSGLALARVNRCAVLGLDITVLDLGGDRAASEAQPFLRQHARMDQGADQ